MPAFMLKLVSSVIVILAISGPYLKRQWPQMCIRDRPVIDLFGKDVIKNDKTIDRKRVSDVVFEQPDFLSRLNGIIHPAVKRYILKSLEEQKKEGRKLCVVEAALFLEEHYQDFCDEVWYVHTCLLYTSRCV